MVQSGETYYGWADIANEEEAIEFVADLICRGSNKTEVKNALREYFPNMDYITVGKLYVRALKLIHSETTGLDREAFVAESIYRLKRLMANQNEKTKNVLAADSQLTHLLSLVENVQTESPDEIAAKIRDAVAQMDASMNIYPKCATCKNEIKEPPENVPSTESETPSSETGKADGEVRKTHSTVAKTEDQFQNKLDAELTKDEITALKMARLKRIKSYLNKVDGKTNENTIKFSN